MKAKQHQAEENKALKAQIKALEKQNDELKLQAHAYKTMIDIAEKELNIPVRKKFGPGDPVPNGHTTNQRLSTGKCGETLPTAASADRSMLST